MSDKNQTIFLSYAHASDEDRTEELVWLVKAELERRGHANIWLDQEQIRDGHWRERIVQGLHNSKYVLSFLSRRSVRDPGVCLNEIGIALGAGTPLQTIMAEPEAGVSPPLSVTHIQWLDWSSWQAIRAGEATGPQGESWDTWFDQKMADVCRVIENEQGDLAKGDLQVLHHALKPPRFDQHIAEKTNGFFGREWLFQRFDQWLGESHSKVFWLTGAPGLGKSAFAASLVHRSKSVVAGAYFCNYQSSKSPEQAAHDAVCTLVYQLASRLPDYRRHLLYVIGVDREMVGKKSARDMFNDWIIEALHGKAKIPEAERMVLLLDGLDEAGNATGNPLAELIAELAPRLPDWMGLFITSRPENKLRQQFAAFAPLEIEANSAENTEDLRCYLQGIVPADMPTTEKENAIELVLKKSEGSFLYLRMLEQQGAINWQQVANLPQGLTPFYLKMFERYFPDKNRYEEKIEPYLRLLVAAPGPLPDEMAKQVLGWGERDKNIINQLSTVLSSRENGRVLFHRSLVEWLQDFEKSGDYCVNDTGAKQLGEFLWSAYEQFDTTQWQGQVLEWLPGLLPKLCEWSDPEKLGEFASLLEDKTHIAAAIVLRRQIVALVKKMKGTNHKAMVTAWRLLAMLLQNKGELDEAERLYRLVVDAKEAVLGLDSQSTASAWSSLALLLRDKGELSEAETLCRRALEFSERVLGLDHQNTTSAWNNLALLLRDKGELIEAESLYRRVLKVRERVLGMDHPDTALSCNNLSMLLKYRGELNEAETLCHQTVEFSERTLGHDHPDTARAWSNLATLLQDKGELDKAEMLYRRSLEFCERKLGNDHRDTARVRQNMATLLEEKGKLDEAENLCRQALEFNERVLGLDNPNTASTWSNLAGLLTSKGELIEAESLYRRVLKVCERVLGMDHPDTALSCNNLGLFLWRKNEWVEAESLCRRALEVCERILGVDHPNTASSCNNLAVILESKGELAEAESLCRRTLEVRERVLGVDHLDTATARKNLAILLEDKGEFEEAVLLYRQSLECREHVLGLDQPENVASWNNLAVLLRDTGRFQESQEIFEDIIGRAENISDFPVLQLATSVTAYAKLLSKMGRLTEAESAFRRALQMRENALGSEHEDTIRCRNLLGDLLVGMGKADEAKLLNVGSVDGQ